MNHVLDIRKLSDDIRELRLSGQLEEATSLCIKATQSFPNNSFFYKILADLYFQQENYEETFIALSSYITKIPLDEKRISDFAKIYYRLQRKLSKEKITELTNSFYEKIRNSSIDQEILLKVEEIISNNLVYKESIKNKDNIFSIFIDLLNDDLNFNELTKLEKHLESESIFHLKQVLDKYILTRNRNLTTYRTDQYCASLYEKFGEHEKAIKILSELLSLRIESVAVRSLFRICRKINNYNNADDFLGKNPSLIKQNDFNILYELVYYFKAKNDDNHLERVLSTIEKNYENSLPILNTLNSFYLQFEMLDNVRYLEPKILKLIKNKEQQGININEFESELELTSKMLNIYSKLDYQTQLSAISDLTTGISHELGQPITNIRYTIQFYKKLLEKNLTKDCVFKIFDSILEETERMGNLIKRLSPLTSSRNVVETFDLIERIQKRVQLERPRLDDNHIRVSIIPFTPITIFGDPVKFDQLISNLLLNAIDAIVERNKKTTNNKITITIKDDVKNVVINFSDTGIGIPAKNKNKIFDPFFSTKAPGKGEGLGLFIIWNLLKSQGGKISVDTKYTNGACFIITIPKKFNLIKETKS